MFVLFENNIDNSIEAFNLNIIKDINNVIGFDIMDFQKLFIDNLETFFNTMNVSIINCNAIYFGLYVAQQVTYKLLYYYKLQ